MMGPINPVNTSSLRAVACNSRSKYALVFSPLGIDAVKRIEAPFAIDAAPAERHLAVSHDQRGPCRQ